MSNIRNTVRASSQRGYPSLAFKVPQRRREFILVVPRRRQGDWRGQYFSTLATELQQYDVQVTLWHYQHYPTSLFREGAGAQRASLFTLHSQYPQAMLIVAVSEFAVFNPVYQNRLAWTRHLQSVPDHLLWFDTPLTASRADSLRQAHFNVLEFSEIDGPNALFDALLHGFPEEQSGTAVQAKTAIVTPRTAQWYQLPESLEHLGDPSVAHNQPEPEDIKNLLEWLRWVLGSEAFALLCAAAVYPRPDWRLTRVLAGVLASERPTMNRLLADKPTTRWRFVKGLLGKLLFWRGRKKASVLTDNSLHNEEYLRTLTNGSLIVLRRLAQLPWLQHGFLPRWLRLALLNKLDIRQEALVADTYSILLDRTDRGQNASVHDLVIDVPVGGFRAWLGALRGRGALQDTLFASVVSRRGVFRFSRRLSRAVRWGQLRWGAKFVQAATVALAMALTGLLSWFGYGWLEPSTTDAGLDAVIARRFGQNEQVTVTIEHLVETKTLAEQVAFTLRNFQYTVVLDEVPLNASSGAATEPGNSLSVPQEHADLLKRLVQWTLYGTPVITFENSSSPIAARLQLQVPLMSRQGFSDRLVNAEDVPLPEGTVFEPREVQPVMKEPSGAGFVGGSSTSTVERPNMVTVPAGRFVMGSAPGADGASGDEFPAHEVNLSAFELGRNEVTWGEWDVCQSAGACPVLDKPEWLNTSEGDEWRRHPVVNVSKADALKYIEWLNNSVAGNYRLPSEAEWEYAARAGTDTEYSWGDEVGIGNANCNGCEVEYRAETTQVGSYQSNPWKLNDMHGNVWERTEDCWHENYVNAPEDGSAWTDNCTIESVSVLRGGSWDDTPAGLRAAYRGRFDVGAAYDDVGFRLARTFP